MSYHLARFHLLSVIYTLYILLFKKVKRKIKVIFVTA